MNYREEVNELMDKLNMNFSKDQVMKLTVALLQEVFEGNHNNALRFLEKQINNR